MKLATAIQADRLNPPSCLRPTIGLSCPVSAVVSIFSGMRAAERRVTAAAAAVLLLTVLAACGGQATSSGCASTGAVTSAAVTRPVTKAGPPGGIPGMHARSRNVAQAATLYQDACRLVAVDYHLPPNAKVDCPNDIGLHYDIVFSNRSGELATANYAATGCESFSMAWGAPWTQSSTMVMGPQASAKAGPFDAALAAILGVGVATLHRPF